jgi:hypothetical protein
MGAESAPNEEADSLNFKPNLDALLDEDDEAEEEEEGDEDGGKKGKGVGIYKAPRLSATPYEMYEQSAAAKDKKEAKLKKILSRSQILREEQEEMSSRPRVVKEMVCID